MSKVTTIAIGGYAAFLAIAAAHGQTQIAASSYSQVAAQSMSMDDLRHSQAAPTALASAPVVSEDLSRVPLAAGYLLSLQVFDAPDLSGIYGVDLSGDLTLPLIGRVHVAGLNIAQAQASIAAALKKGEFILNPSVTLTVQEYVSSYVTILGEVQAPGQFPLLAPHSVQQVLALAGGPTLFASGSIEIRRRVHGVEEAIDLPVRREAGAASDDAKIMPGDQVTVRRAGIVYILGGVSRPGGYLMQEGGQLDLVQAIALAAGTTMQAATGSIRVVRRKPDGSVAQIPVDYRAMMTGKSPAFVLHSQDVVYVPISKTKAALTGGAVSVLGTTSAAAIYVAH